MFLFENILIDAYWNRLHDCGKRHDIFHAMAELKQIAQSKNLKHQI